MITDRDFLRAEADYLRPPTERDLCECEQCGAIGVDLDPATARHATVLSVDEGALICGDCATGADEDAEGIAESAASVALSLLSVSWQRRGTSIPTRRHFVAVEAARAECATGVATRAQGWVAL
jgi:hypothetical protein